MQNQITLPDGWNEVTLEQWMNLESIKGSGIDSVIQRIAIISGLNYEDVRRLNSQSINALADSLQWMTKQPEPTFEEIIELNGKKYQLQTDVSSLESGCFIDLESLINDGASEHLHLILSCLYRPIENQEYNGINDELANQLLQLPITTVQGASQFFFLVAKHCINITGTSLQIQEKMMRN